MSRVTPQFEQIEYSKYFDLKLRKNFKEAVADIFGTETDNIAKCSDYILSGETKTRKNLAKQNVTKTCINVRAGENSLMAIQKETFVNEDGTKASEYKTISVIIYGSLIQFPVDVDIEELHTAILVYDETMKKLKSLTPNQFDKHKDLIELKQKLEANFKAISKGKTKNIKPELINKNSRIVNKLKKQCKANALRNILVSHNLVSKSKTYTTNPDKFIAEAPKYVESHIKYIKHINETFRDIIKPDKKLQDNIKNEIEKQHQIKQVQEVDLSL